MIECHGEPCLCVCTRNTSIQEPEAELAEFRFGRRDTENRLFILAPTFSSRPAVLPPRRKPDVL